MTKIVIPDTEVARLRTENARLREALTECAEVAQKAYVAANMEAINAGPSHPLVAKIDAWRVRCFRAVAAARAALSGPAPGGGE